MSNHTKKILDRVIDVFAWASFILAVLLATITVFASFSSDQNGREIFGVKLLLVTGDSMSEPEGGGNEDVYFSVGDLVIIKRPEDATALKEGQIITFISYNPDSYSKTITHKIRTLQYDKHGMLIGYTTYGVHTNENDLVPVKPESILGVYVTKVPTVGNLFTFLKSPRGYALSIITPSVLLIIFFSIKVGKIIGRKEAFDDCEQEIVLLKSKIKELEEGRLYEGRNAVATEFVPEPSEIVSDAEILENPQFGDIKRKYFPEKLINSNEQTKEYFNVLHNELCSYKRVNDRFSFKCASYRLSRRLLAKITLRGKTLKLHVALDENEFDKNVYHQTVENRKSFADVPFTVKVKSERGKNNAIKLITALMEKENATKIKNYQPRNGIRELTIYALSEELITGLSLPEEDE